ncbi:MAG: hypothetical protein ACYCUG_12750 [Acidimicrobiales bacterium]
MGLIAFAGVAFAALHSGLAAPLSLTAALGAWAIVAVGLYVLRATGLLPLPRSIAGRRPAQGG